MKINQAGDAQVEQHVHPESEASLLMRTNSSQSIGLPATVRELPGAISIGLGALNSARRKATRVSLPHPPMMNSARIEVVESPTNNAQEQRSLFKTLLIRQQQQRESARSHFKVSKPVKPEVADAFEGDAYLMESMSCEAERVSYNAIAAEKINSPSIIRNKHIKTMTQLLSGMPAAIESQHLAHLQQQMQEIRASNSFDQSKHANTGREGVLAVEQQRLFKRSKDSPRHHQGLNQAAIPLATEQQSTHHPIVCKTMSSVLLDEKNKSDKSQQSDTVINMGSQGTLPQVNSCTVLLSHSQKRKKMFKNSKSKDIAAMNEPMLMNTSNVGELESQTLAQKVVKSQTSSALKNNCEIRKNRNNSAVDVSRKLFQGGKPKLQQALGLATSRPILQYQAQAPSIGKEAQKGNKVAQAQSSENGVKHASSTVRHTKHSSKLSSLSGKAVAYTFTATGQLTDSANFSSAANLATFQQESGHQIKVPLLKLPENFGMRPEMSPNSVFLKAPASQQRRQEDRSETYFEHDYHTKSMSSRQHSQNTQMEKDSNAGSSNNPSSQLRTQLLKPVKSHSGGSAQQKSTLLLKSNDKVIEQHENSNNQPVQPKKSNPGQTFEMRPNKTKKQLSNRPSVFNQKQYDTFKEPISVSQHLTVTAVHQAKHPQSIRPLEKRTISAVEITPTNSAQAIESTVQLASSSHVRLSQNSLIVSRNPKQVYSQSRPIVLPTTGEVLSLSRLQTGSIGAPLSTRSLGLGGTKKEIKCVVTKQTKFNEERQQQQQQQLASLIKHAPLQQHHQQVNQETTAISLEQSTIDMQLQQSTSNASKAEKKTIKKLESLQSTKSHTMLSKTQNLCKNHKNYSNAINTSISGKATGTKPSQPTLMLSVGAQQKKAKTRKTQQNSNSAQKTAQTARNVAGAGAAACSADKNKEKQQRRQIVQKIKNQLVQAFETHREVGRLRQDFLNNKQKQQQQQLANSQNIDSGSNLNTNKSFMMKTFDEKLSSPMMKMPALYTIKTPTKEPNPHRPQQKNRQYNSIFRLSTEGPLQSSQMKLKSERKKAKRHPEAQNAAQAPHRLTEKHTQGLMQSERRCTVYSDSHSMEKVRGSKPTFLKPEKKGGVVGRPHKIDLFSHDSDSKSNLSASAFANLIDKSKHEGAPLVTEITGQPLETMDYGKQVPPEGLFEELQLRAQQRSSQHKISNFNDQDHSPTESATDYIVGGFNYQNGSNEETLPAGYVVSFAAVRDSSRGRKEEREAQGGSKAQMVRRSGDYQSDWKAMSQAIQQIRSPSESVAREVMEHQALRAKYFVMDSSKARATNLAVQSRDSSPDVDSKDSGTNDAFSDSQFGEIADEDNYKNEVKERDLNSMSETGASDIAITAPQSRPTANLSGKYTSCTNKNDALNFQSIQKRLPTIRQINYVSQTESGGNLLETAKQILSKKGSKCKCTNIDVENQQHDLYTGKSNRKICGNFCKHLSGRQQKKIVKKLLLENFKQAVENALKSNQRLALAQVQNPFMLQANFGCLADRKFLISASWWSKWCDYVNFNVDEHGITFPKESFRDELLGDTNEEDFDLGDMYNQPFEGVEVADLELEDQQNQVDNILRLSIYQQSSFATLAEAIENDNEQSQLFYERPDVIENGNLMEKDQSSYRNQIKRTLVEHFDYEVVPHSVWQHFYSWYSADVTICRKLVIDSMANKSSSQQVPGGMIDAPSFPQMSSQSSLGMQAQDSSRANKFKVVLDLWPTQQQTMFGLTTQGVGGDRDALDKRFAAAGLMPQESEDVDDPVSNDTTQLLYKKLIEDYSSTANQTSQLICTPEQGGDIVLRTTSPRKTIMNLTPQYRGQSCTIRDEAAAKNKDPTMFSLGNEKVTRSRQACKLEGTLRNTVGGTQAVMSKHYKPLLPTQKLQPKASYDAF